MLILKPIKVGRKLKILGVGSFWYSHIIVMVKATTNLLEHIRQAFYYETGLCVFKSLSTLPVLT